MENEENFQITELIEHLSKYHSLLADSNEETSLQKATLIHSQLNLLLELIHKKCSKFEKQYPNHPNLNTIKRKVSTLPPLTSCYLPSSSSSHPSQSSCPSHPPRHPSYPLLSHPPPPLCSQISAPFSKHPPSSYPPPPPSPPNPSLRDSSNQVQDIDFLPEMIPYNSTDITELSSEISAINTLANEISHMVFNNSEVLDQIEVDTADTLTKVEQGKLELVTAAEETIKRRKNKIKMFFMTLGGLIGIKGGGLGVGVGAVVGGGLGGGVALGLNPMKKQVESMSKKATA